MFIFGKDDSDQIKNAGLKNTPARTAVIKVLKSAKSPIDVEKIIEEVNKETAVNQATIYRILDLYTKKGIVERVELGEGKYRYELQAKHHHHLVCINCGKIEDVEVEKLSEIEDKIKDKKGFQVKSHSLEFFGLCKNCQR
jgi:Fur family transcriptional regulator, ferric uptake regulator